MNESELPKDIVKSVGDSRTEKLLAQLCDKVFLKLWTYPNPHANHDKKPPKEICDVLAVFENHVFIFSDKESELDPEKINYKTWDRWKRNAIDASIKQVRGAERWIKNNPENIFVDKKCTQKLPIPIDKENLKIHRIIVAHGAEEACKKYSSNNINGSLGVCYSDLEDHKKPAKTVGLFVLRLPRKKIIHVFDSHNLEIILGELDTVHDLLWYFEEKEEASKKYGVISHCGEQDLLAHYLDNYDEETKKHYIGEKDKHGDGINIIEGLWEDFIKTGSYQRKKEADKESYFWDNLLQRTLQKALDRNLASNGDIFKGETPLIEMAREPRFSRRIISGAMKKSIDNFPPNPNKLMRHLGCYPSFYHDRMYIFLQLACLPDADYITEYRPTRRGLLEIACGVAKNKYPHLKKIIGIATDPPKLGEGVTEDFILMDCEDWTEEQAEHCKKVNKETGYNFFETKDLKMVARKFHKFPPAPNHAVKTPEKTKRQRNDPCPCGSGKKYKKCCYLKRF